LASGAGASRSPERVRHRYGWQTEHRLQLAHPDPAKEIELIRTRSERRIAVGREQWAQWLHLPIASAHAAVSRRPAEMAGPRTVEPSGVASF
jgi:hypothetical protein